MLVEEKINNNHSRKIIMQKIKKSEQLTKTINKKFLFVFSNCALTTKKKEIKTINFKCKLVTGQLTRRSHSRLGERVVR